MQEKRPKVSIILAAYNTFEYISDCLASIPERDDIEVILVDDASDDGTEIELIKYCRDHKGCIFIHNDENIGVALSRNEALDIAFGDYVTILDSDDSYVTDVFEDILDNELVADLVYFDLRINNGDIWKSKPETRFSMMDHCVLINRELIGDHRYPNKKQGSGYLLNIDIQKELDKRGGTIHYTNKVAYNYNYPREGSIIDLFKNGLIDE